MENESLPTYLEVIGIDRIVHEPETDDTVPCRAEADDMQPPPIALVLQLDEQPHNAVPGSALPWVCIASIKRGIRQNLASIKSWLTICSLIEIALLSWALGSDTWAEYTGNSVQAPSEFTLRLADCGNNTDSGVILYPCSVQRAFKGFLIVSLISPAAQTIASLINFSLKSDTLQALVYLFALLTSAFLTSATLVLGWGFRQCWDPASASGMTCWSSQYMGVSGRLLIAACAMSCSITIGLFIKNFAHPEPPCDAPVIILVVMAAFQLILILLASRFLDDSNEIFEIAYEGSPQDSILVGLFKPPAETRAYDAYTFCNEFQDDNDRYDCSHFSSVWAGAALSLVVSCFLLATQIAAILVAGVLEKYAVSATVCLTFFGTLLNLLFTAISYGVMDDRFAVLAFFEPPDVFLRDSAKLMFGSMVVYAILSVMCLFTYPMWCQPY